jgi:lipopolysaccharide export system permease protein
MSIIASYLIRQYCQTLISIFSLGALLLLITNTFDVLMRHKSASLEFSQLIKLTCYKIPYLISELSPLLCALSVLMYLIWLIQTNQLINIFNSGFSIIFLVRLFVLVNLILGLIVLLIINPCGSILLGKFDDLEQSVSQAEITKTYNNVILKEEYQDVQNFIYIGKIDVTNNILKSITILTTKDKLFNNKLECESAKINNQKWSLSKCKNYQGNNVTLIQSTDFITKVTLKNIAHYLSPIYNIPIWQIPSTIQAARALGSQTKVLEMHYYKQLFRILLTILISLVPFYSFKVDKSQIFKNIVDSLVIIFVMFLGVNILTNILINYINSAIMCNIIPVALCLIITIIQIRHTYINPI